TTDSLQLRFPHQLRLKPEKVQLLLESEKYAPLIKELGSLFYKLESRPEILHRLPSMLNGPMNPPPMKEGLPVSMRDILPMLGEKEMRNFAQRYLQVAGGFEEELLTRAEATWLSFLVSDL